MGLMARAGRMAGVRKWLGRIFIGVSILLLVGTVGMWVRSQRVFEFVELPVWIGAGDRPAVRSVCLCNYRGSLRTALYFESYELDDPFSEKPIGKLPRDLVPFRYAAEKPHSIEKDQVLDYGQRTV